ncbi:protein kinase PKP2 KNAG_0F02560 [Huiozyma naganishii CBS 8797]|uniref:Protein-serine/threonine kinase n=1 Tax=Huiozyma naganishii (strain ATCC MYA-139 / BCRC 22969 / CBS 8797 / KCTC 17520 / NBRC 10181 / NCYC 3082 / Yp74L-3) TaxID=1071383 RepID=J7S8H4_HUIN7|nr:hypothetical protein KNAG_0F02560 [Kazachstania naganishii CBS 8797]CCK70921.1 hypothetical protein KNAG_0F02560 [Kazachstania naganishii CBS 8797]
MKPAGPCQKVFVRFKHSIHTPSISQIPDFSKYSPIQPIKEGLAPYLFETMKAYPNGSKYVNQQHYYHNKTVLIENYARRTPNPVSLTQLAQYYDDSSTLTKAKIINSGKFVKEELAIRMAKKLRLLQNLPFNVVNNFHFVQVYESYYDIFERFRRFPTIRTLEDNMRFAEFTKDILQDFNSLNLPHLVMGALECTILDLYPTEKMDELLSDLLRARISRRLIVEEHLSVTANFLSGKNENTLVLGDIFQECSASEYVLEASRMCQRFIKDMYYDDILLPELIIKGTTDLKFYFLPTHLKYLLGELLRNAYTATTKEFIRKGLSKPTPIEVTIIENPENYLFKISDNAGGLLHPDENIWSFGKSKARASESLSSFHRLPGLQTVSIYDHLYEEKRQKSRSEGGFAGTESRCNYPREVAKPYIRTSLEPTTHWNLKKGQFKFEKPLIEILERPFRYKLGIGLAMCKVYADYWNGDLSLHSMPGYGVDTVLKLGNLMKHTQKKQLDKV